MSEDGLKRSGLRRRLPAILVALAICVAGGVWAGCGDDSENGGVDAGEIQDQVEQGVDEATDGVEKGLEEARQGVEEGGEEAREGIEKGKEEAEEGIEKGKEEAQKGVEGGEDPEKR